MKGLFHLLEKLINEIVSHFEQGNKTHRKLKRIELKSIRVFRDIQGYYLDNDARLSNAQLEKVFLPESQNVGEAWDKLRSLDKDKRYSLLLLLVWASECGKPADFPDFPQVT